MKLTIGSRGSPLALVQAEAVAQKLTASGCDVVLKTIKTQGDKMLDVPLAKIGGKGLFVKELETSLLIGDIDLAVHSMKDMPGCSPGLVIGAVLKREDPRDVLISRSGLPLAKIPAGGRIGTSSLRRQAQLSAARPDLVIVSLRGNLNTRMKKLSEGKIDAVLLAAAGLHRMGWHDRITEYLPLTLSLPAVGQGALVIECREGDHNVLNRISFLNDPDTAFEIEAERAMLARLEGGCQVPIAGFAKKTDGVIHLEGRVSNLEGTVILRAEKSGPVTSAHALGIDVAESLLAQGADSILRALLE